MERKRRYIYLKKDDLEQGITTCYQFTFDSIPELEENPNIIKTPLPLPAFPILDEDGTTVRNMTKEELYVRYLYELGPNEQIIDGKIITIDDGPTTQI